MSDSHPDTGESGSSATQRRSRVSTQYDRLAGEYESRWSHYVMSSVRETVRRLPLTPAVRVLDVGCGTGLLLSEVKERIPDAIVVGLDVSRNMLGVAKSRAPNLSGLVQADVHYLPFAAGTFDLVVSSSSFHYWWQPREALRDIVRALSHGGQVVITDWCDDFLACRIADRILRIVDRSHQRILGSRQCTTLLETSGFEITSLDRYKIDWLWGLMTVTAMPRRGPPTTHSAK